MITYKLKQTNEEWRTFNSKVIRMNVDYEVSFYVPAFIDFRFLEYAIDSFENLEWCGTEDNEDGYYTWTYRTRVSSISKCDIERDKFSEDTGIYICETRAEIKILNKIKKIIDAVYKNIKILENTQDTIKDQLIERLDKNIWNLERLKGTYEETEN